MSERSHPPPDASPTPSPDGSPADASWAGSSAGDPPVGRSGGEPFELSEESFSLIAPEDDEAPPPRRPVRRIVLGSLLAVAVAGAAVVGTAVYRISSQKDATMTVPATIGGLRLQNDQEAKDTADYLQTVLSANVSVDKAVGAVYKDATNSVLLFGGTALIWTPEADLDTTLKLISDDQGAVTDLHDVPAGPLGGTMKCGTTKSDGSDMAVCGWADHGSLAVALFPNRPEAESAGLLREIRAAVQKRN